MSYVVLARKWRPQTFSDLVGQDHVSQTLANAIANDRVAHAFLFTGVRGVGKTTSARILAKALNCMASQGPTSTPCLKCSACQEITDGRDLDVMEIDGASYNGVDEVRRLQESLPYRPNRDRYKIYIVDEVHMLSTSAWNAFLKTLEEPPPHVKFIFATTEVHKVPVTILSRVQRFDFKMIPTKLIVERLHFVLGHESVKADAAALTIIAREAAGSMRDAMSLLDQVIAWSDTELTGEDVARVLGVANRQAVHDLAAAVLNGGAADAVTLVASLANQGFDMGHVARDVLSLLRDIVVAGTCKNIGDLIDLPDEELEGVKRLAAQDSADLVRVHQGFSAGYDAVVRSPQPRAALEMLLVRLATRPPLVPIDDLVERLIRLEKKLYGTPGGAAPSGGSGGRTGSPAQSPRNDGGKQSRVSTQPGGAAPSPQLAAPLAPMPDETEVVRQEHRRSSAGAAKAPVGGPHTPSSGPLPAGDTTQAAPRRTNSAIGAPPGETSSTPAQSPVANFDEASQIQRWRMIVDLIRPDDAKVAAFLDHAQIDCLERTEITIGFEESSVFEVAVSDAETRERILTAATKLLGAEPRLHLKSGMKRSCDTKTVAEEDRDTREQRRRDAVQAATMHPFVQEAIRVFGARVKAIELPKN